MVAALTAVLHESSADPAPNVAALLLFVVSARGDTLVPAWKLLDSIARSNPTVVALLSGHLSKRCDVYPGETKKLTWLRYLLKSVDNWERQHIWGPIGNSLQPLLFVVYYLPGHTSLFSLFSCPLCN